MDKELQSKLVDILGSIQAGVGQAKDFALSQLPDIAQSYVAYGRVSTLVASGILLAVGMVCGGFAYWAYSKPWNNSSYSFERDAKRSESNICVIAFCGFFCALFCLLSVLTFDLLVWVAPKVWLLQKLSHLIH